MSDQLAFDFRAVPLVNRCENCFFYRPLTHDAGDCSNIEYICIDGRRYFGTAAIAQRAIGWKFQPRRWNADCPAFSQFATARPRYV